MNSVQTRKVCIGKTTRILFKTIGSAWGMPKEFYTNPWRAHKGNLKNPLHKSAWGIPKGVLKKTN